MTDIQDEIRKVFAKKGLHKEINIFGEEADAIVSFDLVKTLPETPPEDIQQPETTEDVE